MDLKTFSLLSHEQRIEYLELNHATLLAVVYHVKMFILAFTVGFIITFFLDKIKLLSSCCRRKSTKDNSMEKVREFFKNR